jgi:hypothetical protein
MQIICEPTRPPERRNLTARDALIRRVRGEFAEMPCLRLTFAQAQRLFALRADVCQRILGQLVAARELSRGPDGRYQLQAHPAGVHDAPPSRLDACVC